MKRKTIKSIIFTTIILLFCSIYPADADENQFKRAHHGIYIMLNANMHDHDFMFPYLYDLHNQETMAFAGPANTYMAAIGLVTNIPISKKFVFSGRLGLNIMGGTFEEDMIFAGQPDTMTTQTMDFGLNYFEISPTIQYHDFLIDNLYIMAGIELGLPFLARFTRLETITGPEEVEFEKDGKSRLYEQEVEFPDTGTRLAGIIGVGFTFPVGKKLFFSPEISYRYPVTQVSSSDKLDSWNVSQIRFGISLSFDLSRKSDIRGESIH